MSDLVFARPDWSVSDLEAASRELDRAIRSGPNPDELIYYKAQIRELMGDVPSAASWLDRLRTPGPGETIDTYDYERHVSFVRRYAERVELLRHRELGLPVYVTAMPHSGEDVIALALAHLLGAFRVRTAKGQWARGTLVPRWVHTLFSGCGVAQDCFPASPGNVNFLAAEPSLRLTVHVRHPADVLAAMFTALNDGAADPAWVYIWARELDLPPFHFAEQSREAQLMWLVRNVYPALVAWMEGWLRAYQRIGARLAFTRYEDLIMQRGGMIGAVLMHAGFDPFDLPALDGGVPTSFQDAVNAFEGRLARERGRVFGHGLLTGAHLTLFARTHGEYMARLNDSPVFEAFDYAPVSPSELKG